MRTTLCVHCSPLIKQHCRCMGWSARRKNSFIFCRDAIRKGREGECRSEAFTVIVIFKSNSTLFDLFFSLFSHPQKNVVSSPLSVCPMKSIPPNLRPFKSCSNTAFTVFSFRKPFTCVSFVPGSYAPSAIATATPVRALEHFWAQNKSVTKKRADIKYRRMEEVEMVVVIFRVVSRRLM